MATVTVNELAAELHSDPRTTRKFLRSIADGETLKAPGKGGRWQIEKRQVRGLAKKFGEFTKAAEERAAKENETEDEAADEMAEENE